MARRWSIKDIWKARQLYAMGYSLKEVAVMMHVSYNRAYGKIVRRK